MSATRLSMQSCQSPFFVFLKPTKMNPIVRSALVLCFSIFPALSLAADTCDLSDGCPACGMDYAPFKPWFKYYNNDNRQTCWNTISCTLTQSDEARKQQYAAIALIMGIVPLALKDVSWPERRTIPLSTPLPKIIEILVRTLSLEPEYVPSDNNNEAALAQVQHWWRQRSIARWAWQNRRTNSNNNHHSQPLLRPSRTTALLALLAFALAVCYTALALVEVYSKRAVLGCPYPIFVLSWHLLALLPAAIHTACAAYRAGRKSGGGDDASGEAVMVPLVAMEQQPGATTGGVMGERRATKIAPNVFDLVALRSQAAALPETEEWWITGLMWAIYYVIGTLVYTSISTVTVIELFVWVVISFATTAFGRLLAFALCMAYEGR